MVNTILQVPRSALAARAQFGDGYCICYSTQIQYLRYANAVNVLRRCIICVTHMHYLLRYRGAEGATKNKTTLVLFV
jgi:hypothetical protein